MLVQHFLEKSARRLPDKVALICSEKRLTYREMNHQSDRLAGYLIEMGIQPQDKIAIFLDNSSEAVVALFGILKAGAVFIILNPGMKAKKLDYVLKDSGAIALISQTNKSRIIEPAVEGASDLKHIIQVGDTNRHKDEALSGIGTHQWNKIFSGPDARSLEPAAAIDDSDLATIIYTSGSTGVPKGVMSAHRNVVAAARSITSYLENTEDDIILSTLPLSFGYGLYQVLMAFLFGGTVVLEKSFAYPFKIIERLVEERATGFPVVPTMLAILLQMRDLAKLDLSGLRYITNAAAALPVSHIQKFRKTFPTVALYSMYGLTECTRVSYLPPEYLDLKPESVGIPMPGVEVAIVKGNGEALGPGQIGELVVTGSNVMRGYWNDPDLTARTFRPGNAAGKVQLYTGDLFKKDDEGFLYFVSRKDDLIKIKGERVSPKEIENVLCKMDGILEAAVIGVLDEILGQAIKVFIVPADGSHMTEAQVFSYCRQNFEPFIIPKYVSIETRLPKLSNGKIDKKRLS